jgi:hypothetical protein
MQIKEVLDIPLLLQRFPGGFAVTPSGKILEVVGNFQEPEKAFEIKPPREENNWGFLVVAVPLNLPGDSERFEKKKISTQDFYKVYESQVYYEEDQVKDTVEKLNTIGVGIDQEHTVEYKPREQGGFSLVLST